MIIRADTNNEAKVPEVGDIFTVTKVSKADAFLTVDAFWIVELEGNSKKEEIIVKEIPEISRSKAKELIINYLKSHKSAYISELAENLVLDLEMVIDVVDELERGKVVKEKFDWEK